MIAFLSAFVVRSFLFQLPSLSSPIEETPFLRFKKERVPFALKEVENK
jgi:hypothetical protein